MHSSFSLDDMCPINDIGSLLCPSKLNYLEGTQQEGPGSSKHQAPGSGLVQAIFMEAPIAMRFASPRLAAHMMPQAVRAVGEKSHDSKFGVNNDDPRKFSTAPLGLKRSGSLTLSTDQEQQAALAKQIECVVFRLASLNTPLNETSVFTAATPVTMPLQRFIDRLMRYVNKWAEEQDGLHSLGVTSAVIAMVFLERSKVSLSRADTYRGFLAAFHVAFKLTYDFYVSNSYFAKVGGVTVSELNALETSMCSMLGWNFAVSEEAFEQKRMALSTGLPLAA
jgi:hypothetical protein